MARMLKRYRSSTQSNSGSRLLTIHPDSQNERRQSNRNDDHKRQSVRFAEHKAITVRDIAQTQALRQVVLQLGDGKLTVDQLSGFHVKMRHTICDSGEYAPRASQVPSLARISTVSPGKGLPSICSTAPEKIHG